MNSRSIFQSTTLLFAWVIISFFSSLTGQSQTGRGTPSYAGEKPVVSYYEDLDDKTFYHQRRIYGMKGELNNYSEKLHNLQARFDQIFYGPINSSISLSINGLVTLRSYRKFDHFSN